MYIGTCEIIIIFPFQLTGILFFNHYHAKFYLLESMCSMVFSLFFHIGFRPHVVFAHIYMSLDIMLTEFTMQHVA